MNNARSREIAASIPSVAEINARLAPLYADGGLQLVVLFGSAASSKMYKRSDIDLAFLFDAPQGILERTNRVLGLLRMDNVYVVDLRRASPLLRMAVVRGGNLLYERSPGLYADSKKLRDAQSRSVISFSREEACK